MNNNEKKEVEKEVEEPIEQKKENKKAVKKIALFVGIIVVLSILYAIYWIFYGSKFQETEDAYVSADQNAITSQVSATVVELNIQDGQVVKQGYQAITLDNTDAKLALERAKSDLERAVRSYGSLQLNVSESQTTLNQRKTDLNKAQDDFKRDSASYEAGVLSQQDWLNSKHKLETAQLAVSGANSSYINTKTQAKSKTIYNHPDVEKAINAYRQAYIDLFRTEIKVPVDGTIVKRAVYIGQKIAPNQTLFTVINQSNEWVDANLKESQLENVKIGQSVELKSDVNGKRYQGYVTSIGAGSGSALSLLPAQNATGNWIKIVQRVPVRIDIEKESLEKNGALPIGTSVFIAIDTRKNDKKVKPSSGQKTDVYKIDEDKLKSDIDNIVKNNIIWK